MSAVVEFLLARIAEDEQDAHAIQHDIDKWHRERAAGGADGSQGSITLTGIFGTASDPVRVLAEREAKRRIVAQVVPECDPGCRHPPFDAHWIVRELAAVYADHPDYLEEWRP